MMTDENKSDELALNFESAANRDELESARRELAQEAAASGIPAPAHAPVTVSVSVTAPVPMPQPAAVSEPVLRSRMPVNRPAGTPPVVPAMPAAATIANLGVGNYGATLRTVREAKQLDLRTVEKGTQIALRYIEAIERENLDALPPLVYVIGYIRTLCRYYNIDHDSADKLVAELKEKLEYPCNQELMNSLEVDNSGAEANEKRLRQIFLVAGGAAVLVVVLIAMVLFLVFRKAAPPALEVIAPVPAAVLEPEITEPEPASEAETPAPVKFDPKTIYPLLEPATPQLVKLPVAE